MSNIVYNIILSTKIIIDFMYLPRVLIHLQGTFLVLILHVFLDEILESNDLLRAALEERDIPRTEILDIPVGDGYTAKAKIVIPPASDRDQDRKWYPVLFHT